MSVHKLGSPLLGALLIFAFDFLDRAVTAVTAIAHCEGNITETNQKLIKLKIVSVLMTSLLKKLHHLIQHSRLYTMHPKDETDETKQNSVVNDHEYVQ
jgi:hypothetical protein